MRPIRSLFAVRSEGGARRRTSPVPAAVGLAVALALTATACDSGGGGDAHAGASAKPLVCSLTCAVSWLHCRKIVRLT